MDAKTQDFDVQEIEYLRHGDKPLLARIYTPQGPGPFPALVECHGGAWCQSDRFTEKVRHEYMASHGAVSVALDFRSGNEDPYPASVQDINYAVRWVKLNAARLKTRPEMVGLSGQSSGGHLAMLVAMRPRDPRYAAIALPPGSPALDATVPCVIMSWPVINPLGRYRLAVRARDGANPPEWPKSIIARQDSYWRGEANMAEGNPMLALERGEKVLTPPAIWFQAHGDLMHDYKDEDFELPRQRAAALRRQLQEGRWRDRPGLFRRPAHGRPFAGPVEDGRELRPHDRIRDHAHESGSEGGVNQFVIGSAPPLPA